MDIDKLNYKTLRKIQQIEEKTPALSKINPELYINFSDYIKNLNLRFKNEINEQRKIILKNEINNTKKIIKNIYEQREKKILIAIMTKVRGGEPNLKNLVNAEKILFESILEIVIRQRQQIMDKKVIKNNLVNDNRTNIKIVEKKVKNENNKIFLVRDNIPEFIGTDTRKYNLRKDDLITIPKNTSELLLNKRVIKEIKKKIN
jgi:DNA replication initiation complex subunit (GINS family)